MKFVIINVGFLALLVRKFCICRWSYVSKTRLSQTDIYDFIHPFGGHLDKNNRWVILRISIDWSLILLIWNYATGRGNGRRSYWTITGRNACRSEKTEKAAHLPEDSKEEIPEREQMGKRPQKRYGKK